MTPSLLDELEEEIVPSLADMLAVVDEARMHMAGRLNSNGCREITDRRLSELRENIADMAKRLEAAERDAAYGRALIEAMNAEYQAAKESRKGGKQEAWITTYTLLRRLKVAADHLTDMGNPITEQDQELAAIDAAQEG